MSARGRAAGRRRPSIQLRSAGAAAVLLTLCLGAATIGGSTAAAACRSANAVSGDQQMLQTSLAATGKLAGLAASAAQAARVADVPAIKSTTAALESAGEEAGVAVGSAQPCSAAGRKWQALQIEFVGYLLASENCIAIVKANPNFAGVDEFLACIAPINAAITSIAPKQAPLETAMFAHPCTGLGPTKTDAAKAAETVGKIAGDAETAASLAFATNLAIGNVAGATDELIEGFNSVNDTMGLVVFDTEKAVEVAHRLHARHPTATSSVPPAVEIWQTTAGASRNVAAKLQTALRRLAVAKSGGIRRRAAALAEYQAQRLAIDLDLLRTSQAALPAAISDPQLQRPLTAVQIAALKKAIATGKVRLGSRVVSIGKPLRNKLRRIKWARFVGKRPLSLFTDAMLTGAEARLANDLRKMDFATAAAAGRRGR
jgi:hypothetical protein